MWTMFMVLSSWQSYWKSSFDKCRTVSRNRCSGTELSVCQGTTCEWHERKLDIYMGPSATSRHQKSMEAYLEVGSGGQFSPSAWPHNLASGFRPLSATVVSAEPFSLRTGTLRCLQKEMATCWSVSLWRDPDDVLGGEQTKEAVSLFTSF